MKKSVIFLSLLNFMIVLTFAGTYKLIPVLRMCNSTPISTWKYQRMLGVGIDVNWLSTKMGAEYFMKSYREGMNVPMLFKERGFNHVRIRVSGNTMDAQKMTELKIAVNECLNADLIPVISYVASNFREHPDSKAAFNGVITWWTSVAKAFKGYPYTLSYDIIIETSGKIANSKYNTTLNTLYQKVVSVIHAVDPHRIVFVTPNDVSNPYYLKYLKIPNPSTYVMVEWHFYAGGPSKRNPKKLWTTGTAHEKSLVLDKINYAYNWSMKYRIPTWVGAWMATDYNKMNRHKKFPDGAPDGGEYTLSEEENFALFMAQSLKAKGIPYAINADNKYFNAKTNTWYKSVEKVLDIILNP